MKAMIFAFTLCSSFILLESFLSKSLIRRRAIELNVFTEKSKQDMSNRNPGNGEQVQNEEFLLWEQEELQLWNDEAQRKNEDVLQGDNDEPLPRYMLDLLSEFGGTGLGENDV